MALIDPEVVRGADTVRPSLPKAAFLVRSQGRAAVLSAVYVLASASLLLAGTTLLPAGAAMWLRTTAVSAGLVFAYLGLRSAASVIVRRPVDLALYLSVGWVLCLVVAALLAPVLPLGEASDTGSTLGVPPLLRPDLLSDHPLGTNQFGLDILSRVVWGARQSLTTSFVAIALSTIVGGMIGLLAGHLGGWTDRVIRVLTNSALAFPPLVLLLVLGAIFGHSIFGVAFALAVLSVAGIVRLARAHTFAFASREHAYVAEVLGATRWQVLRREMLPPVAMALVSVAFLTLPLLIVAEAALSYVGLGVRPPSPTWGNMIAEGGNGGLEESPHIVLIPGAVLVVTVFALNLIGQRLRARWER